MLKYAFIFIHPSISLYDGVCIAAYIYIAWQNPTYIPDTIIILSPDGMRSCQAIGKAIDVIFSVNSMRPNDFIYASVKHTNISSDNGLLPGQWQVNIWTSARILLIGRLGKKFCEIVIEIYTFLFKKLHLKMSSGKWRPFCLNLNRLRGYAIFVHEIAWLDWWVNFSSADDFSAVMFHL